MTRPLSYRVHSKVGDEKAYLRVDEHGECMWVRDRCQATAARSRAEAEQLLAMREDVARGEGKGVWGKRAVSPNV